MIDKAKKREREIKAETKRLESQKQLRVWLDLDTLERAKDAAADRGMTLTEYVKRLLDQGLIK
jgi:predicted DNA binding CopG/RHH family protein